MRRENVLLQEPKINEVKKIVAHLQTLATQYRKTAAQIALRWLLQKPGVTAPIIGASNTAQLEENVGALGWVLQEQHSQELDEISAPLSKDLKPHDSMWNWHPKKRS